MPPCSLALMLVYRAAEEHCDMAIKFLATENASIVALSAITEGIAWNQELPTALGYHYTAESIVANGVLVTGTRAVRYKEDICFITGHSPQTGEEICDLQ